MEILDQYYQDEIMERVKKIERITLLHVVTKDSKYYYEQKREEKELLKYIDTIIYGITRATIGLTKF